MLSTGIPELQSEEDIKYLRDSLCLSKDEEQANQVFTELIREALNSKSTQWNFFVHNVVQKRKSRFRIDTPKAKENSKEAELP